MKAGLYTGKGIVSGTAK